MIEYSINLPASKSESNRALIIQALATWQSGANITIHNLSEANDTLLLQKILEQLQSTQTPSSKERAEVVDAQDAGTSFRFLTAYLAITGRNCTLTGTPRMQERPVGILVEALRDLGADITYTGKGGYPPLQIKGFTQKKQKIDIQADVSSQFISALLLVAPVLPQGLCLHLVGKISSKPYIEMTLQQMQHFGIKARIDWEAQTIEIAPQHYQTQSYTVESDWSAASYWYSAMALLTRKYCPSLVGLRKGQTKGKLELLLQGLRADSLQGDKILTDLMQYWGIKSKFVEEGVVIYHVSPILPPKYHLDFTHFPDLAQSIIPMIAHYEPPFGSWQVRYPEMVEKLSIAYPAPTKTKLIYAWRFTGLESLHIKETDRLKALQNELAKLGVTFEKTQDSPEAKETWRIAKKKPPTLPTPIMIDTYHDHRMAMGFAPLELRYELDFINPKVVVKSYPDFWQEWEEFKTYLQTFKPVEIEW
jgi:3-phosphoshikimate 1-carboxyvinyltransferase